MRMLGAMTSTDILILTGSIGIFTFAAGLAAIATNANRSSRHGREALACAAAYLFSAVPARMLTLTDTLSQKDARVVNGLLVFVFLAILAQIYSLHRLEKKLNLTKSEEPGV
mgnify:CR=1 FL=1